MSEAHPAIKFRGVRVHNLKNLNIELKRDRFTVVTGVSGSGKSSLAFDTVYAEGQRRYVESLSAYARQFLEKMDKPELDGVENIPPAIAIQQKPTSRSSRSTVGTATEIYDYLRLLFARIGTIHCRSCGKPVRRHTVEDILDTLESYSGKRAFIVAPMGETTESTAEKIIEFARRGFIRVMVDGEALEAEQAAASLRPGGRWGLVVDRVQLGTGARSRLADSLEMAYGEGDKSVDVHLVDGPVLKFTGRNVCPDCNIEYEDPFPQLFSFNSPLGACPECNGFGNIIKLDLDLIVPDREKTLNGGAIKPWTFPNYDWPMAELRVIAEKQKLPLDIPFEKLSKRQMNLLMNGKGFFPGINKFFDMLEKKKYKLHVRVLLSRFRSYVTCPRCGGARLKPEALAVKIQGNSIADVCRLRVLSSMHFFEALDLTRQQREIADLLLKEIIKRLRYLVDVGLDYLTLDRLTRTLSGGEAQRINLASCLGSGLTDTLYILDEPSIGMHPRDNDKLIGILSRLRDTGNTVLVVEHDADIISAADEVIDLGPGAGERGGSLVFQGPVAGLKRSRKSLTGQYLSGKRRVGDGRYGRRLGKHYIRVLGAREHNLKDIDVDLPLGVLVCVTGVSGSGKSTLVEEILYRGILRAKGLATERPGEHSALVGVDQIRQAIMVDQSPIGRTPRSNPITYMHAFSEIRELFASTLSAQLRQLTPSDFSFNVKGGRCPKCRGDGTLKIDMQFLADVYLTCDICDGTRYKPSILEVRYKDKNIHEVLEMTVTEAYAFFGNIPSLKARLKVLISTGLGYLKLGQPSNVLSAGEAQRLKLASHIADRRSSRALFIFDEPTTGLHFHDIGKLVDCFHALVDRGNSVIVVEHNMEVIRCADYLVDLGPEGGENGGTVVACGTPETVAGVRASHTGRFLRQYLSGGRFSGSRKNSARAR